MFAPDRHLLLEDPRIEWAAQPDGEALAITLQARSLARFVELSLAGAEVVFSDNSFDLPAGRAARVICPVPAGWGPPQAPAALRVRSLVDIYSAGELRRPDAATDEAAENILMASFAPLPLGRHKSPRRTISLSNSGHPAWLLHLSS